MSLSLAVITPLGSLLHHYPYHHFKLVLIYPLNHVNYQQTEGALHMKPIPANYNAYTPYHIFITHLASHCLMMNPSITHAILCYIFNNITHHHNYCRTTLQVIDMYNTLYHVTCITPPLHVTLCNQLTNVHQVSGVCEALGETWLCVCVCGTSRREYKLNIFRSFNLIIVKMCKSLY